MTRVLRKNGGRTESFELSEVSLQTGTPAAQTGGISVARTDGNHAINATANSGAGVRAFSTGYYGLYASSNTAPAARFESGGGSSIITLFPAGAAPPTTGTSQGDLFVDSTNYDLWFMSSNGWRRIAEARPLPMNLAAGLSPGSALPSSGNVAIIENPYPKNKIIINAVVMAGVVTTLDATNNFNLRLTSLTINSSATSTLKNFSLYQAGNVSGANYSLESTPIATINANTAAAFNLAVISTSGAPSATINGASLRYWVVT